MKKHTYAFLAAIAACGFAQAAETAYTTPVGYVSLGNTTGPAIPANTDAMFTIPLDKAAVFAGTVSSVDTGNDIITITGTTPLGATDYTATPHIVKIGSGAKSGLIGTVLENDGSTITIAAVGGEDLSGIVSGDKIEIQTAWTLGSLFEGVTVPTATQVLAWSGANPGVNLAADEIYEYEALEAGKFADTSDYSDASDKIMFPGEAFIVRTPPDAESFVGSIPSFVVTGTVPTSNSRIILTNPDDTQGQDNFVGYVSPVGSTIGDMTTTNASAGDQILLLDVPGEPLIENLNKGASVILEYEALEAGKWANTGDYSDASDYFVPAGQGLIYRVAVGVASPTITWTSQPVYVPTL